MTEADTETQTETLPVNYNVPDAAIAELAERFQGLTAETTDKYKVVVKAIAEVRTLRVGVDHRRKELKRDALDYGKRVDDEAKRITAALREVEDPLKEAKAEIDDEKAKVKAEAEAKEKERVDAIQAKINDIGSTVLRVYGKDADTIRGALADLEWNEPTEAEYGDSLQHVCQVRAEQIKNLTKAVEERESFEAEQAELFEQREKQEKEQAKLDAQRAEQEEEQAKLDEEKEKVRLDEEYRKIEAEAKETAEREAREKLEREAKDKAEKEEAERLAEEERLLARSDGQKLDDFTKHEFPACIRAIPEMSSLVGRATVGLLRTRLDGIYVELLEAVNAWEEETDG